MKKIISPIIFAVCLCATAVFGASYNLSEADWNSVNISSANPWSLGYADTASQPLKLIPYLRSHMNDNVFGPGEGTVGFNRDGGADWDGLGNIQFCSTLKSPRGAFSGYVMPEMVFCGPAPTPNIKSVVCFTAPKYGVYKLDAKLTGRSNRKDGDKAGSTVAGSVYVKGKLCGERKFVNGEVNAAGKDGIAPEADFTNLFLLEKGDALWFAVDSGDDGNPFDICSIDMNITEMNNTPMITGLVSDTSGQPLEGAVVSAGKFSAVTDDGGKYSLPLPTPGKVDLKVTAKNYVDGGEKGVEVASGETVGRNFKLTYATLAAFSAPKAAPAKVSDREMKLAAKRYDGYFSAAAGAPFSFTYNGKSSRRFLVDYDYDEYSVKLDGNRTKKVQTFTDPDGVLQVRCESVKYNDFPTMEWVVYIKNISDENSGTISEFKGLDAFFEGGGGDFVLHRALGSPCTADDYMPITDIMKPGATRKIGAAGGRPTNSDFSYFNLETAPAEGVIIAVGWPGQWTGDWKCGKENMSVKIGQEYLNSYLLPGEEIRSTMTVMQYWRGEDWYRAQNIWRKWMFAHNLPQPDGKPFDRVIVEGCSSIFFGEMVFADTDIQKFFIDKYAETGINPDYWWMDAGWYPCSPDPENRNPFDWVNTGTWEVDRDRFPNGLREISDFAKTKGIKTMVWFEPERIGGVNSWLMTEHPDWVNDGLLDLANPECLAWAKEHFVKMIKDEGIDLYRQDFNIDPLSSWLKNDEPGRAGMKEQKHCVGVLDFWDTVMASFPGIFCDSCASGGRRNELEFMRRSIPMWRTDYCYNITGTQSCTYGISLWIPMSGTGTQVIADKPAADGKVYADPYKFFGNAAPSLNVLVDVRRTDIDYESVRRCFDIFRNHLGPAFFGDYYPLTEYSSAENVWIGYEFNLPDKGKGIAELFRRPEAEESSITVKLRALEEDAEYEVTELLTGKSFRAKGADLCREFTVTLDEPRSVALYEYKKL
ncbi:MAG: alpha-galactosidase [Abditibacteriota bacterium]|nr:alpha-galactosidase [Abditibacteriota bacterium]